MMSLEKTCTASQLLEALRILLEKHGDLPVYAKDADTHWLLPIGLMYREAQPEEGSPARLEITTDYYCRPLHDLTPNALDQAPQPED